MEPIILRFDLPSLSEQKVTAVTESRIVLYDRYMEYFLDFEGEDLDEELAIWTTNRQQDDIMLLKNAIVGITISLDYEEDMWKLVLYTTAAKIHWFYFTDEFECRATAKEIKDWLLS